MKNSLLKKNKKQKTQVICHPPTVSIYPAFQCRNVWLALSQFLFIILKLA